MAKIRIVMTRAPGLIPSLLKEIDRSPRPVVLIPESFTLACETEIVRHSQTGGIFDMKILSPSSLIREVRELTGGGTLQPISGDGQNMIVSRLLRHHRGELKYYRDSAAQPTLAAKISAQIDELSRARLTPDYLREYQPLSRRTAAKLADVALIWEAYEQALAQGFADTVGQWKSAVSLIRRSGLLRNSRLLIYGFDYITHDLRSLAEEAAADEAGGAEEVVIGLICDDTGPDREIFRSACDSVRALCVALSARGIDFTVSREEAAPRMDAGIAYAEKTIYALGAFPGEKTYRRKGEPLVIRENPHAAQALAMTELEQAYVPDLSHVRLYYAKNSYIECQHACQTLIDWHRRGIPWEDMAVAVCEQDTLPSLLPLTLSAAGIPFNAKRDQPILQNAYAQYILSLLRMLRLNFCQADVLRMLKTGFSPLTAEEVMDMENYARAHGVHRGRWLQPFPLPEKKDEQEKARRMEELRQRLIAPVAELKKQLSRKECTGRRAAELLFQFVTDAGAYSRLLAAEDEMAARGDDAGIDRNRQVWTAVNELLDTEARFIGEEPLPMHDLCAMLEASLTSRNIKSLPQQSRAVTVAPPQMFFSSGVRCMLVMGLQENELSSGAGVLSERERNLLEQYIEKKNSEEKKDAAGNDTEGVPARPYPKIGQSLLDLAARQKQDVYQAVSLAREELMLSCASAKSGGGVMTPSAAFRRLAKTVRESHPGNVAGSLLDTELTPFAPAFALEALAARLRETKDSGYGFLEGKKPEDLLWRNALASMYQSDAWKSRVEGVLKGLHIRPPEACITPDQARRLYLTRNMTVSRVETFGACPYRHFLQYGLDLFPSETFAFRRDEQGSFNHDVLQQFLERAMKLPEWPDLSEETETRLLNRVLRDRVKRWEGDVLTSDMPHRYQGAAIIRGIRTSVSSLMRSFRRKPHFLPMAAEVPFGPPDPSGAFSLPAVQITAEDGTKVAFAGRIDRIDRLETGDGRKFFMIVDNKMSSRDVKGNSVAAGLQLQLPLYIRAAREGLNGYEAAGGLYQPVREVLIADEDQEKLADRIDRELQTSGVILADPLVQEAMHPVKISRAGRENDTVNAVSPEELKDFEQRTVDVITEQVNRIRAGEASARPVKDGRESPCAYCDHPACPFDATIPGCRVREVDHKHALFFSRRG